MSHTCVSPRRPPTAAKAPDRQSGSGSGVDASATRVTVIWEPGEGERWEKHFEYLAALTKLTKPLAKPLAAVAAAANAAKHAEGGAEAMRIYKALPRWQQRRMRDMTIRDILRLRPVLERGLQPRARPRERRSARRATVTTSRRRTQARAGPDDGSGSDEPPPERDLARLPGFGAANVRMFAHVGRRLAAGRAAG
jgi:hypothetical protein